MDRKGKLKQQTLSMATDQGEGFEHSREPDLRTVWLYDSIPLDTSH